MNYQKILIGRDTSCDLVISHDSISRKHAELFIDFEGNVFVTDLSSKNGTYVNNRRIFQSEQLFIGDILMVGNKIDVDWAKYLPNKVEPKQRPEFNSIPQRKSVKFVPYLIIVAVTLLAVIYIYNLESDPSKNETTKKHKSDKILIVDENKPLDNREVNVHVEDKSDPNADSKGSSEKDNESQEEKNNRKKSKIDASCLRDDGDMGTTDLILMGEELDKGIFDVVGGNVTREEEEEEGKNLLADQRKRYKFIESGKKYDNLKNILKLLVNKLDSPRGFNYQIHLIESDEWNAFTAGGQIFVTTTIYDFTKTSDELACIIAHEIYHNELGHINESIKKYRLLGLGTNIYSAITQSFGQKKETYCDLNGIDLAVAAGFQGCAAAEIWYRMSQQNGNTERTLWDKFQRTHPYNDKRQNCAERHMDINYNVKCKVNN
jgi:pSer/pThr/pTyr-binding forkhead associated (FHA) protein